MKRALDFVAALIGGFVALYLFFLLPASAILSVVESNAAGTIDPRLEHLFALFPAGVGAFRYAVQYDRGRRSLERLWTFVIVVHLLTYVALFPYFHVADARGGFRDLLAGPGSSVAYYVVGYALLAAAIGSAYVLVYRDAYGTAKRRIHGRFGPSGRS